MEEYQEPKPVDTEATQSEVPAGLTTRQILGLVLVAIVVLLLVIAAIYGMVSYPFITAMLRDISIIVLALVTVVIGVFLIVLIFQLQSLLALLRYEIKPILDSANETANTVRGTTTFVSDAVVTPMIQVASFAAGVTQTLRVLAGTGRKRKGPGGPPPGPVPEQ